MPAQAPSADRRRLLVALAKAALTVAILVLVFTRVSVSDLSRRLATLRARDVALLLLLTVLQVTLGVVRWWRLLRRLDQKVPFAALFGDVLVGLTYNLYLPTTIGGDAIRALRARARGLGHHAWSTSIFERIAGLVALSASGAVAATIGLGENSSLPREVRWLAVGIAAALIVAFFASATPFRLLLRVLERRLPTAAVTDLRGIASDLEGPLARAGARIEALSWSLTAQAVGIAFVIVGARGMGAPGHALALLVGVPIIHVLSMMPVTLGGHGLREGLYVGILAPLGLSSDVALGLAAQWLASSLLFGIIGAAVALWTPKRNLQA